MQNAQIEVGCAQDEKIYTFLFFLGFRAELQLNLNVQLIEIDRLKFG